MHFWKISWNHIWMKITMLFKKGFYPNVSQRILSSEMALFFILSCFSPCAFWAWAHFQARSYDFEVEQSRVNYPPKPGTFFLICKPKKVQGNLFIPLLFIKNSSPTKKVGKNYNKFKYAMCLSLPNDSWKSKLSIFLQDHVEPKGVTNTTWGILPP